MTRILTLAGLLLALILVGCTGGSEDAGPPPNVDETLHNAAELISAAETFKLEIIPFGAPFDFSIDLGEGEVKVRFNRAIGQFIAPNEVGAEVTVDMGANVDLRIYAREDDQWYRPPLVGWINAYFAEGFDPSRVLDDQLGFQALLDTLSGVSYVGYEDINGTGTYHFEAMADGEAVSSLLMLIEMEGQVPVDVFISRNTGYPVRVEVEHPDTATEDDPNTVWRVDVFDINEADTLVRPQ